MPTKRARIALIRDPEVDAALKSVAPVLGASKPDATLARELLPRDARAVLDDPDAERHRGRAVLARVREMTKGLPPGRRSARCSSRSARTVPDQ
jgi:hypothetical protein